jgi:hypothetical protein
MKMIMQTQTKLNLLAALCGLLSVGSTCAADPATAPAVDPEADRLLRATCASLAATPAFSFNAEIWEDTVVFGHKVATTKTVDIQVRRPDRVQVEMRSPHHSRGVWYDGRSLTLLDREHNLYGTVAAPDTIDKVLDAANDKFGFNFPLEDLLVNDPYASASAAIKGGVYFGKVTILGTPCQHIAFSTDQVDWQLWIQDGPDPLPRKLVLTYKREATAPQLTALFSDWKLKCRLSDKTFVFTPPKGAAKIEVLPAADTDEAPAPSTAPQTKTTP